MVQRQSSFVGANSGTIRSRTLGVVRIPPKPAGFQGSELEYIVWHVLILVGKTPGVDFTHQSGFFGGRLQLGGAIVDFLFEDPPGLAINVQGQFFHYERGRSVFQRDVRLREILATRGVTLIFIDEDDLLADPIFYIREALAFRDHSRLTV